MPPAIAPSPAPQAVPRVVDSVAHPASATADAIATTIALMFIPCDLEEAVAFLLQRRARGQPVERRGIHLQLRRGSADFAPRGVVDRNPLALAARAGFPFRLARDPHLVEPGCDARLAQRLKERAGLGGKHIARAEAFRVDDDRQHAIPDALLRAAFGMPRSTAGQRTAEQLADHRKAVALVHAEGTQRAEWLDHAEFRVRG